MTLGCLSVVRLRVDGRLEASIQMCGHLERKLACRREDERLKVSFFLLWRRVGEEMVQDG